jgi:GNAT superfamily N-acetyltransferase
MPHDIRLITSDSDIEACFDAFSALRPHLTRAEFLSRVTVPEERGRGYASQLLDWLVGHAQAQRCDAVHLDTGYGRHDAHRLYLKVGFELQCPHVALQL